MKIANAKDWITDAALYDGAPLDLGQGRTLYVKRYGQRNRAFIAAISALPAGNSEEANEAPLREIYARTLIAGWSGFTDANGQAVPYSVEECVELLQAAPEIFDAVSIFAAQRANFRTREQQEERDEVKKS